MTFRHARPHEAEKITRLTLASKRHWGYPEAHMKIWEDELIMHPDYIETNWVMVAEEAGEMLGYASILEEPESHVIHVGESTITGGFYLDNLFVDPAHIRHGVGLRLLAVALDWCREQGIEVLYLFSDPNARGFYERMGATYLGEYATIGALRPIPCLSFHL